MIDFKKQVLLVVAPHPDDEVLGCAGLMKKVKNNGGKVYVLFLTNGTTHEFSKNGVTTQQEREKEINAVSTLLQIDGWKIAFPGDKYHLSLDTVPQKEIIHQIEKGSTISLETIQPTMIATTYKSDYNQDHRACFEAVIAATRPAPPASKPFQPIVFAYEFTANLTWSLSSSLTPNMLVSLTDEELETKIQAMQLYESQVRDKNHTRSLEHIKNLARLRGAGAGVPYAEAFQTLRIVL